MIKIVQIIHIEDNLKTIVTQAGKAPSWANAQAWKVYIATGDTLARIRARHEEMDKEGDYGHSFFRVMHLTEWAKQPRHIMADWGRQARRLHGVEVTRFLQGECQSLRCPDRYLSGDSQKLHSLICV